MKATSKIRRRLLRENYLEMKLSGSGLTELNCIFFVIVKYFNTLVKLYRQRFNTSQLLDY